MTSHTHGVDYGCARCGLCTCSRHLAEYYMVAREIWRRHGAGRGMLCIGCLEARMGRPLVQADFLDVRLNTDADQPRSPRLADRLRSPPGPLLRAEP